MGVLLRHAAAASSGASSAATSPAPLFPCQARTQLLSPCPPCLPACPQHLCRLQHWRPQQAHARLCHQRPDLHRSHPGHRSRGRAHSPGSMSGTHLGARAARAPSGSSSSTVSLWHQRRRTPAAQFSTFFWFN